MVRVFARALLLVQMLPIEGIRMTPRAAEDHVTATMYRVRERGGSAGGERHGELYIEAP